jgi:predicted nuclease of restriction endonuclease-like (RecB) superfamily
MKMSAGRPKRAAPGKEAAASRALKPSDAPTVIGLDLLAEVRELILTTRQSVARGVNAALTMLYWQIGTRIRRDILNQKRAGYGEEIVPTLSAQLAAEFGASFGEMNLRRMVQFAEVFPDEQILVSLIRELSWTHFIALIPLKDPLKREFYAEMCRVERWSTRTLRQKIDGMLYERTALSKKPAKLIEQELAALRQEDKLTPDLVFKDPYFLDFLGLRDTYSERDLEAAILREIERFLLEMGAGFAFVERQKRIVIDDEDFYLDLLFFHRRLRRLVLVELKLGAFQPADFGQTTLYLRWLDRHERQPGEEAPIGLILCAGKSAERVELLELEKSGIRVSEYLTELPPKEELQRRLHEAVAQARARLEQREEDNT